MKRISAAKSALKEALEPLADEIAQVRVAIAQDNVELDDRESYKVVVYFVVDEELWGRDLEGRKEIYAAFSKFVGALKVCNGIEVDDELSDVVSGGEFSWQSVQQTHEWNFANLSHREQ